MNNLRTLRGNRTQDYIAKQLGLSQRTYSNYENETRQIPDEIKLKIADYFNVSVDYLLGRTNEKKMPDGFPTDINTFAKDLAFVGFPVEEFNLLDSEAQQKAIENFKLVITGLANKQK